MDTDMKWFMILLMAIIVLPMIGLGVQQYEVHQCRMEGIRANWPAENIEKVCK